MDSEIGSGHGAQPDGARESAAFGKVTRRLVPLLFLAYFLAYLDRVNVGVAKLQMAADLHLSDAVYGFGAGIFFFGYFLFEVPSNLILRRVGARLWIARIMITWGLISAAFAFTGAIAWGPVSRAFGLTDAQFSFYAMRFVLGLAEAGFYPGVVLYLTFWFPDRRRAQIIALFMAAIPLSGVIGSPISGSILEFADGVQGWSGWQWLFVIEGIPAALTGLVILLALPDRPGKARWLDPSERDVIVQRLRADESAKQGKDQRHNVIEIFWDFRIWTLAIAELCITAGGYAVSFWAPTIVQELGVKGGDYLAIGLILMIPWGVTAVAMVAWARHSDRTGERRWHATLAACLSAAGLVMLALAAHNPALSLTALAMISAGTMCWFSVFWSIPTSFLSGAAAAGGIAMINSIGNLGGYFGPDLVGAIREANGGETTAAFLVLAGGALVCAVLTFLVAAPRANTAAARK